jgi:hypothetical protein
LSKIIVGAAWNIPPYPKPKDDSQPVNGSRLWCSFQQSEHADEQAHQAEDQASAGIDPVRQQPADELTERGSAQSDREDRSSSFGATCAPVTRHGVSTQEQDRGEDPE